MEVRVHDGLERQQLRLMHAGRHKLRPDLGTSPIQLGLRGDPWKILVACALLNRTQGVQARPVLAEVLERWPTPTQLAKADPQELEGALATLGLQRRRSALLIRMAQVWLSQDWQRAADLPHVGKYAEDALRIFALGRRDVDTDDVVLGAYLRRLREADEPRDQAKVG
jgi:methyl-CpG-binding domain protein 4